MEDEKLFFISTREQGSKNFIVYASDIYKLTELEVISLIKLLLVDRRGVSVGRKILEAYKDATEYKKEETLEKLEKIGVIETKENGTTIKRRKTQTK